MGVRLNRLTQSFVSAWSRQSATATQAERTAVSDVLFGVCSGLRQKSKKKKKKKGSKTPPKPYSLLCIVNDRKWRQHSKTTKKVGI
jgi:hypothetical protein